MSVVRIRVSAQPSPMAKQVRDLWIAVTRAPEKRGRPKILQKAG